MGNMYTATLIGDALGRAFEGLTRAHIRAHCRASDNYIDATPLLKGNMHRWTKPGLYSAQGQMMLVVALACTQGFFDEKKFGELIDRCAEGGDDAQGLFRNPPPFIHTLLQRRSGGGDSPTQRAFTTAGMLPLTIPLSLAAPSHQQLLSDVIRLCLALSMDASSQAAALSFAGLIYSLTREDYACNDSIAEAAVMSTDSVCERIGSSPGRLFSAGTNPETLLHHCKQLGTMLSSISSCSGIAESEKTICSAMNQFLKTPITRATVDHPLALYPYAIALVNCHDGDAPAFLYRCASLGGATTSLVSLVAAINLAAGFDQHSSDTLAENLANKKCIATLSRALLKSSVSDELIQDFIMGEKGLTAKEAEERKAKLKHVKPGKKKAEAPQRDREQGLTQHVVESWTKIDKARWKKERKNLNNI
jgi:hypothetical protein